MLIKWICCTVPKNDADYFAQCQKNWSQLTHVDGFVEQFGGWSSGETASAVPGEQDLIARACVDAHIVCVWSGRKEYDAFMVNDHDRIVESSYFTTAPHSKCVVELFEQDTFIFPELDNNGNVEIFGVSVRLVNEWHVVPAVTSEMSLSDHLAVLELSKFEDMNLVNKQRLKLCRRHRNDTVAIRRIEAAYNYLFDVGDKMDNAQEIINGVFLGPVMVAQNFTKLRNLQIKHILSVAHEFPPAPIYELCAGGVVSTHHVGIKDEEHIDFPPHMLNECLQYINQCTSSAAIEKENILIHCQFGKTRSAMVTVVYLALTLHISIFDAYERVISIRDICVPPAVLSNLQEQIEHKMLFLS